MKDNKNNIYELFLITYIMLNGVAVGQSISSIRNLIAHPDSGDAVALGLWLSLIAYTGNKIYKIRQAQKNNKDQGR
ncbi:MAG: hypothetical protein IJD52_04520 [Alphaproteobacteria bacterium]|nr:hypothetical protein [Alphaproteobacteria bacterium]